MVYPTNVLHLANYTSHSSAFPEEVPAWFIKLFTEENGVVLDPFVGSGTSAVAAKRLGRNYIGIDIMQEYCDLSESNLKNTEQYQYNLDSLIKTEK
jgi:DNA modification methylase